LRSFGDVFTLKENPSARGRQRTAEQVDERGLACAIGPDQRMARADSEFKIDLLQC